MPEMTEMPRDRAVPRRAVLAAAAASLLIPLAACAGSSPGGTSGTSGAAPSHGGAQGTVTVLAAASLTDAFGAEAKAFEKANPGTTVRCSFAGSQDLVAQVREGAPADVLVTADTQTMASVRHDTGVPTVIARNRLTIVTAPGNPKHLTGLADLARPGLTVDLAAPQVPVGHYGAQVLAAQHVTVHPASLETNVRAVLTKVELGEADAGIVYVTDAASAKGKVATVTVPDAENAIASYPAATIDGSKNASTAADFVAFLASTSGQRILRSYGFQQP